MQIIQTEPGSMGLFSQEQDNLPEVVPDETIIRVPGQASEGESDKFLEQQKVLLFVVVKLMKGVELVGG
jgi:hypothetical protein